MPKKMRQIEIARLWDNGQWDTEIIEVPRELGEDTDKIISWFDSNRSGPRYKSLEMIAVYNTMDDEQDDEEA